MADRWMDEHDRERRDRDWRRSQAYGRGDEAARWPDERRSWTPEDDRVPARRRGPDRDRVFGERETGASYTRPRGGYGDGYHRDYTEGGRYLGDDERRPIWREEYGQGGVEYGDVPRGYDAGGRYGREAYDRGGYGEAGYGRLPREPRRTPTPQGPGGTGGYDYGRVYGQGRTYGEDGVHRDSGERWEEAGRNAGEFLHRAGERVASWFGGDDDEDRRGYRGYGPKGYKRSDERISDEAHERLTDDTWLDASNISVSVSGGEITLSGTVENRESKHRAERLVEDLSGVGHVQNNLRVARQNPLTATPAGYGDSAYDQGLRTEDGAPEADKGG